MDEAQRARAEKIVEMWINGELATPHDGVRAIVAALAQARREALEEAAKIVLVYNCDHNHGKAATKACDEIEEAIRERAQVRQERERIVRAVNTFDQAREALRSCHNYLLNTQRSLGIVDDSDDELPSTRKCREALAAMEANDEHE